jgi:hypothetical protein
MGFFDRYFDALASSSFKTAQDGRRLFFPWGPLGPGYVIGSEQDFIRLEGQIKMFLMVSLVVIIGLGVLASYLQSSVVVALLIGFYAVWARDLTRRLQRSDERLSREESWAAQVRAHSARSLWWLEIASLAMTGGGIWMFFVEPEKQLVAVAGIVFFGIGAVTFAIQLVQRNREPAV